MPSDSGQIVLGIDLDGVCADFYGRMREICAEFLEKNIDELPTDVSYGLPEWGIRQDNEHYLSLHRFAVNTRGRSATSSGVGHSRRGRDVRRQIIADIDRAPSTTLRASSGPKAVLLIRERI